MQQTLRHSRRLAVNFHRINYTLMHRTVNRFPAIADINERMQCTIQQQHIQYIYIYSVYGAFNPNSIRAHPLGVPFPSGQTSNNCLLFVWISDDVDFVARGLPHRRVATTIISSSRSGILCRSQLLLSHSWIIDYAHTHTYTRAPLAASVLVANGVWFVENDHLNMLYIPARTCDKQGYSCGRLYVISLSNMTFELILFDQHLYFKLVINL